MLLHVLDLEMNQPSGAIIQIGAVCMDMKTGIIKSQFSQYINPQEKLDERIIALTGITQEMVDGGRSLKHVLEEMFWPWLASKHICAWGSDVEQLIEISEIMGLRVPEGLNHYDAKAVASILRCAFPSSRTRGGLKDTMDLFGVPFIGRQHDGLVDAMNTAKLLHHFVAVTKNMYFVKKLVGGFD